MSRSSRNGNLRPRASVFWLATSAAVLLTGLVLAASVWSGLGLKVLSARTLTGMAEVNAPDSVQAISLSTSTPYTQTFDSIGTTGTTSLPTDWKADKQTTVRTVGAYGSAGTSTEWTASGAMSSSATNGIYNYGAGTANPGGSDRAVGFLSSSTATKSGNLYAQFVNNTGSTLESVMISYDVEKYRNGSNAAGFRMQLYYSFNGTTWVTATNFLTSFPADANNDGCPTAPCTTVQVPSQPLTVTIPNGSNLYLAWNYSVSSTTTTSNAQALAIDNFSILGVVAPPTATVTPWITPSATNTNTPTETPTETSTATNTATSTATDTAEPTVTSTATGTSTSTATATATATATEIPTQTATETAEPTATDTAETAEPTATDTAEPTATETATPTETATEEPTETAITTATETATSTATEMVPTQTSTATSTATEEVATGTSTATSTATEEVATGTSTGTATQTALATGTNTAVASSTSTNTAVATMTPTNTATGTSTSTAVPASQTSTATTIPSATFAATATRTATAPAPATATAPAPATATATVCAVFSDVQSGSTFYVYIRCLSCRGVISGYSDGTFRPGNPITRGQIAKVVSNAAGFNEDPGSQIYSDVPPSNPFYAYINRLTNRGIVGGYPCPQRPGEIEGGGDECNPENPSLYRPNAYATRGQMAKIVSNAKGYSDAPSGQYYADVPPNGEGSQFYPWIMRLTQRGVMSGYQCGTQDPRSGPCDAQNRPYFRPANLVTRGQAAKIVANTFFPECQAP